MDVSSKSLMAAALLVVMADAPLAPHRTAARADAFEVQILLTGVKSDSGTMRSVLCTKTERFPNVCAMRATAPAKKGVTTIVFKDVPAGTYAFAVFHDENNDGKMTFQSGFPIEGVAYSNDAVSQMGPPAFDASAFEVAKATKIAVKMRYLGPPPTR